MFHPNLSLHKAAFLPIPVADYIFEQAAGAAWQQMPIGAPVALALQGRAAQA